MSSYTFDHENHIHTLAGRPLMGTSTVAKVIGKGDALTWWSAGLAVQKFGWLNPKKVSAEERQAYVTEQHEVVKQMTTAQYLSLLDSAYRAHQTVKTEKAAEGTDLHAELEKYVNLCLQNGGVPVDAEAIDRIQPFIKWSKENVEKFLFSEMHTYSEKLWLGGIADAGAVLKTGKKVVIDFKSSKDAYPEQFVQCALYDIQISENGGFDAEGTKVLEPMEFDGYLIVPFGAEDITPRPFYDAHTARQAANASVTLYKFTQLFVK